ncbi:PAS domain-containing protein [Alicyclobacillaceae bacterium I2511]|nr:PAS domain-containing protein [Alicyclobacillaceae bacterium I2511]
MGETLDSPWRWTMARQDPLLTVLLETVEEAVTVVDAQGMVRYWNLAAQRLYKIQPQEIVGKSIYDFPWKSLMIQQVLQDGVPVRHVYHEPRPNVHVLINTSPILNDGKVVGAISTEQDVSHIVQLGHGLMQSSSVAGHAGLDAHGGGDVPDPWSAIWGHSETLQAAMGTAERVAVTDATVLITGESGVGKELFAHAIHQVSPRARGPFIAINCGAIPAPLFESELFGYEAGAFTGADRKGKQGKLDLAKGGTLFLDEVGELSADMQVKLLRVLEEGSFYPVGGLRLVATDVRIIAATNQDLKGLVTDNAFRKDLFYRLNVVNLHIPPLRRRVEDIPLLVQRYLQEFAMKYDRLLPEIDPQVMLVLMRYDWPGNVRQLRNTVQRLVILSHSGQARVEHLPDDMRQVLSLDGVEPAPAETAGPADNPGSTTLAGSVREVNGTYGAGVEVAARSARMATDPPMWQPGNVRSVSLQQVQAALERTYGNKAAAAKVLGISRGTLYNYLHRYQLKDWDS